MIDLFSGTGSVSNFFLKNGCKVTSCDNMTYSIAEQYRINYFKTEPDFSEIMHIVGSGKLKEVLKHLNELIPIKGYYFDNYAPSGYYNRKYFSDNNAKKMDAISNELEKIKPFLSYEKYMFLNGIFMCGCDRVSNTAGTYGAFLKIWRSMALKNIILEEPEFTSKGENIIIMSDVLDCVKSNKNQESVYIDPPYNKRQYASNFHVLENIVVNDKPLLKGKSGLRDYSLQKSNYCISKKVLEEFKLLINNIDSKYIVMSYSTEGLMEEKDIYDIFNNRGETKVYRNNYRRFKTNAWTSNSTGLEELLFICKTNE